MRSSSLYHYLHFFSLLDSQSHVATCSLISHLQCDIGPAYCDPDTCIKDFSGLGSSCATPTPPSSSPAPSSTASQVPSSPYVSSVPDIDVCGHATGGVSCPGAGVPFNASVPGYFYRCCSSDGHCGPKNNIQDQSLYCGAGCQGDYGDCSTDRVPPALPSAAPTVAGSGQTCGPIVNARCDKGLCCSGSNFCGTYCAAASLCNGWQRMASIS